MIEELLTIQEAADFLGVSTKTLRRWEARGVLIPARTVGNQRRYTLKELQDFRLTGKQTNTQTVNEVPVTAAKPLTTAQQPQIPPTTPTPFSEPIPFSQITPPQERVISASAPLQPLHNDPLASNVQLSPTPVQDHVQLPKHTFNTKKLIPYSPYALAGIVVLAGFLLFSAYGPIKKTGTLSLGTVTSGISMEKGSSVLAAQAKGKDLSGEIEFFIPAFFNQKVTLNNDFVVNGKSLFNEDIKVNNKNVDLGSGKLTASNVVYGLTAGANITITGDPQNPTIAVDATATAGVASFQGITGPITLVEGDGIGLNGLTITNNGVLSLGGEIGDVELTGGDGIVVNGTEITNDDPGTAQNIFKNILVDATTIIAGSNDDTLTFEPGTGIMITADETTKKLTFTSTLPSQWTNSGSDIYYSGGNVGIGTTTPTSALDVSGNATVSGTVGIGSLGAGVVHADETGLLSSAPLNLAGAATEVSGILPVSRGGIGIANTPNPGQLLIGNGTNYDLANLTGTANQVTISNAPGSITFSLPQNINTAASPTFASLNLANNTNQLILGSGLTSTVTMETLTANRTITFPDANGVVCLSSGNCGSGSGGAIVGSGTTNYIAKFTSATGISDSLLYESGGKLGLGTTSPQGLFNVSGGPAGQALAVLNYTGSGENILVGSASGTTRFVFDSAGNLNLASGEFQIGGTSVLNGTTLGTNVINSSLTTVGVLASGSISSGFGNIDIGNDTISAGDIISTNGVGFTATGNGSDLTFSGMGLHDLAATSGTLRLGATTLIGDITGNSNSITGLNNLSAGGTVTFSALATGVVQSNAGVLTSSALNLAGGASYITGSLPVTNGGTGLSSVTTGDLLYASGSNTLTTLPVGSSGQVLSISGGVPAWTSASILNYLQRQDGALSPINITDDMLVGGSSTSSAKFQISGLTGNASTSGTFTFNTPAFLQTTNNQPFTIGGGTTGDITLSPLNGNGTVNVTGNMNLANTKVFQINGTSVLSSSALGTGVTASSLTSVGALTSGSIANGFGSITTANNITGADIVATSYIRTGGGAGTIRITDTGNLVNIGTTQLNNVTYAWPGADGSDEYVLTTNGAGSLSWSNVTGISGAGDITSIGDVTSGAAFTAAGTQGTSLYFYDPDGRGQITTANLTAARTYTLPDATGTICLTSGNCAGVGGSISGSGVSGQIAYFNGTGTIESESSGFSWDPTTNKLGIGTDSPAGKLSVTGAASGQALVVLNENGDQDIITASSAGATKFTVTRDGDIALEGSISSISNNAVIVNDSLNLNSGNTYQINGSNVLTASALGTSVTTSSLTSVGALTSGSIANGFGSIVTSNAIQGASLTVTGNGNGLTFSGTGNHDITATSGTLRVGAATLTGDITGNSNSITGLNNLSAAGTITFGTFTSNGGILYTNGSGQLTQVAAGTATQVLKGGTTPSFGSVDLTTDISGTLPIANGGTNTTSLGSAGSVAYSNGTSYVFTSVGSNGQVLTSNGTGAPTWTDTSSLGTNYWQRNNGALAPLNITDDILVGAASTGSATFRISGTNGNASSSGNLTFNSAAQIQSTKNQTLTFGGSSTGNIVLSPLNGNGSVFVNGNVNLATGNIYRINNADVLSATALGNGVTGSQLTQVGALASGSIANGFGTIQTANTITGTTINGTTGINTGAGAGTQRIDNAGNLSNIGTISSSYISTSTNAVNLAVSTDLNFNGTTVINASRQLQNIAGVTTHLSPTAADTYDLGTGTGDQYREINGQTIYQNGNQVCDTSGNCAGSTNYLQLNSGNIAPGNAANAADRFVLGGNTTTSHQFEVNGKQAGKALVSLNETGNQNILTASASGATVFSLDRSGNIALEGQLSDLSGTTLAINDDLQVIGNDIIDSAAATRITLGDTTTLTNSVLTLSGTTTLNGTSLTAINGGATAIDFAEFDVAAGTGSVTINDDGDAGSLTVEGSIFDINSLDFVGVGAITTGGSTDLTLNPSGGNVNIADADTIIIGGHAGNVAYNVISDSGGSPVSGQINSDDDLYVQGVVEASALYQGANQVCDTSGNCAGTTNYLQLNSGNIAPGNAANAADRFVLGGNTTTNHQFEVNGKQTGKSLVSLNETGDQDIFTASSAGTTRFTIANNGNLTATGTLTGLTGLSSSGTIAFSGLGDGIVMATGGNGTLGLATAGVDFENPLTFSNGLTRSVNAVTLGGSLTGNTDLALGNFNLTLSGTGRLGIGTTNPLAALDVRPSNGTTSIASISGQTARPALTVDNTGIGALFTASKSGASKFTILNSGDVRINNLSTANCDIKADATGLLYCGIDGSGGVANYWQITNNAISPGISTQDVLFGGTATNSAKFAFINNTGSGTPTASISAQTGTNSALVLGADGSIQSVKRQTLTLGGTTTGDIQFKPGNDSNGLFLASNGNVGIGTVTPDTKLAINNTQSANSGTLNTQRINNSFTPTGADYTTSSNGLYIYNELNASTAVSSTDINANIRGLFAESPNFSSNAIHATYGVTGASGVGTGATGNVTNAYGTQGYVYQNGTGTITNAFPVFSEIRQTGNGIIDQGVSFYADASKTAGTINTLIGLKIPDLSSVATNQYGILAYGKSRFGDNATPTSILDVNGKVTGKALSIYNETGDQDIFTASASGATKFTILNNGNIRVNNLSNCTALETDASGLVTCGTDDVGGSGGSSNWRLTNGAFSPINDTADLLLGSASSTSAKFAFLNMNDGTPTASISGSTTNNALYLTGDGTVATTNRQTLTLGSASTGNIALNGSRLQFANLTGCDTIDTDANGFLTCGSDAGGAGGAGTINVQNNGVGVGTVDTVNFSSLFTVSTSPSTTAHVTIANDALGFNELSDSLSLDAPTSIAFSGNDFTLGTNAGNGGLVVAPNAGGKSALIINKQSTTGDIFTASASGTTRLTLSNGGNLNLIGGVYQSGGTSGVTVATAGCVTSVGGIVTGTGACPNVAANDIWRTGSGTIYQGNVTQDLLIGSNASSSAKFAVLNVNSGTPTASLSGATGGTYITAAGTLQTTARQTLNIGGGTTGNIVMANNVDATNGLDVTGANFTVGGTNATITTTGVITGTTINATTGLQTGGSTRIDNSGNLSSIGTIDSTYIDASANVVNLAASTDLNFNGTTVINASRQLQNIAGVTTHLSPTAADTYDLGTGTGDQYREINGQTIYQNGNQVCDTSGNCAGSTNYLQLNSGSIAPGNAAGTTDRLVLGGNSTTAYQFEVNGMQTGKALVSLNETGNQNILTASASGATVFNLDRSGNIALEGQLSDLSGTTLAINDDLQVVGNDILDSGAATRITLGATTTLTNTTFTLSGTTTLNGTSLTAINGGATAIDFTEFDVSASTGSVTINDGGDLGNLSVEGSILDINSLDFVGVGAITTGGSTDLTLNPSGGDVYLADTDTIIIGGHAGNIAYNVISDAGGSPTSGQISSDNDLYVQGALEASAIYQGTNQVCDTSGNCAGTTNYLQLNSGSIAPGNAANAADRFVLGGNTTTNHQFEVNGKQTGKALVSLNETGNQNILTASASGITVFTLDRSGNLAVDGALSDISGNLALNDNTDITGNLDASGTLTVGTANVFQVSTTGVVTTVTDETINGVDISTGTISDVVNLSINAGGDLSINSIGLNDAGTSNADSGATLIGVFDEFNNSTHTTLQEVLADLDSAIGVGSSKWQLNTGVLAPQTASNQVVLGGNTTTNFQFEVNGRRTGKALVGLNETGNQDILTASASGTTVFNLDRSGNIALEGQLSDFSGSTLAINDDLQVIGNDIIDSGATTRITLGATTTLTNTTFTLSGTTTFNGASLTAINGGATAIDFTEFDVNASTGSVTINDGGDAGSLTVEGSVFDINSLDFAGVGAITTGGTTDLTLNPTDEVVLGDTDTIIIGGHAGNVAYNVMSDAGGSPVSGQIASDNDLYIQGAVEASALYQGANQVCDTSGNCAGTTNYLQLNSGNIAPGNAANAADRFVLGGNTTTSHQFEVNGKQTGKALVSLNETGNQNILTASASGATVFNLDRSGNIALEGQLSDLSGTTLAINDDLQVVGNDILDSGAATRITLGATTTLTNTTFTLSGTTTFNGASLTAINGGATAIDFTEFDVSASTGSVTINDGGDAGSLTVEGSVFDINSLDFAGVGTITTGGSTDLTLNPSGGDVFLADADTLIIGGHTGNVAYNVMSDAGGSPVSGQIASDNDLYIQGAVEASALYQGANQVCDTSGNCAGLTTTYWNQNNGAVYAKNSTVDLLVGGVSTASAKFSVTGVNSGTPTASLSAGTAGGSFLTASGNLQTTAKQTLTLGGGNTGNIALGGFGAGVVQTNASGVLSTGTATVGVGGTGATTFTNGGVLYGNGSSAIGASAQGTAGQALVSGGAGAPTWTTGTLTLAGNFATANANSVTLTSTGLTNVTLPTTGTLATLAGSETLSNKTLTTPRFADLGSIADSNGNELLIFDLITAAVNEITIGNATTTNGPTIAATGGDANVALSIDAKGTGALNLNNTGTGNILLGGGSGSTGCTLTNSSGAWACAGAISGSNFSGTSSGTNTGDQTITLTGDVTGSGTSSFATTIASNAVDGTMISLTSEAQGNIMYFDGTNWVHLANGTSSQVLHSGTTPSWGAVSLTAEVSGTLPIANGGTNSTATPTNGGVAYGTGTAYAFSSAGSPGNCLISNGAATPTWGSCTSGASNSWQETNNAVSPRTNTLDVLFGGTATNSAKFAFINNTGSGTPTASISAQSGNNPALVLGGDGSIQSVRKQTLTLGGTTTGNIFLNPNAGTGGFVNIGGDVNVSSGFAYQINGTDVLAAGTLGSTITASSLTSVGALNAGSITSGFGTIDVGSDAITGGDITASGTNGLIVSGANAGLNFNNAGGTHIIQGSGTLQINAFTLGGSITGNTNNITGLGQLTVDNLRLDGNTFDATSGDLTINAAGGDIIFSNNATLNIGGNGSDAAYNAIGDNLALASTRVDSDDDLFIEGNLEVDGIISSVDVRGTLGTTPNASVSGQTSFASLVVNNDGVGDLFTASKSGKTHFTVRNSGEVVIGNTTNGISFDVNDPDTVYSGTARPSKKIVLSAEYAGATITASTSAGTNHTGYMTADASTSAALSNFMNYYEWSTDATQGTLQDYTVAVRVTLPHDFGGWQTSNAITIKYNTELGANGSNKLDILLYNATTGINAIPVAYYQAQSTTSKTWTELAIDDSDLTNGTEAWDAAGETAVFYLRMYSRHANHVQVGDITLNYLGRN